MPNFGDIFDKAVDTGFGPTDDLEPGKYTAEIVSTSVGEVKNGKWKGAPRFGFLFKDVDSGGTAWANQTFFEGNEAATNVFVSIMKGLGITGRMLEADPAAALETSVGRIHKIRVEEDGDFTNVKIGACQNADDEDEDDRPAPKKKKASKPTAKKRRPAPEPEPEEDEAEEYEDDDEPEEDAPPSSGRRRPWETDDD